jgi:putative transposase
VRVPGYAQQAGSRLATMPEELITTALQRAFWAQPPTPGLLVYSDRGGQY